MQLELRSPAKKWTALAAIFFGAASYLSLAGAQGVAAYLSEMRDAHWLKRAVNLDPGSAEYRYRLGHYELLADRSPQAALPWLQSATDLNPHSGRYWIDLAMSQQALGDTSSEQRSLQHALSVDVHTPEIAWDAANL